MNYCAGCNCWVVLPHYCSCPGAAGPFAAYSGAPQSSLDRLAAAFERIAAAMERANSARYGEPRQYPIDKATT